MHSDHVQMKFDRCLLLRPEYTGVQLNRILKLGSRSMIQTEIHRTRSSWRILQEAPWPDQILLDFLAVNSSVRDPVRDFEAHSKRSSLACMGKARELTHQKCV